MKNADVLQLLTEGELASRWKLTIKAIQAKRQRGDGPKFLKLGAAVRYRLPDVEAYEADHTLASTSQQAAA